MCATKPILLYIFANNGKKISMDRIKRNMNKLFAPVLIIICLFITSCDNDDLSQEPMCWSTQSSTEQIHTSITGSSQPEICVKADYSGGDVVLTCENYDLLNPIKGNSKTYDCGWAIITIEANKVKCHFPYDDSGSPEATEHITISAQKGNKVIESILSIARTFDYTQQDLPDRYKFKLTQAGFTSFMNDDFALPAPFDLLTFRITGYNGEYSSLGFPEYVQHYDSIVWSGKDLPNTLKIYDKMQKEDSNGERLSSQWSSHFFKNGTVYTYLKGYRNGRVEFADTLSITLYERDFLCFDWEEGSVLLTDPKSVNIYCPLDSKYEYQVLYTQGQDNVRYSKITFCNANIPESEFLKTSKDALKALMKNNVGESLEASDKVNQFKCVPSGVEAELFWENKRTRILLLHQLPSDLKPEKYYLHIESK